MILYKWKKETNKHARDKNNQEHCVRFQIENKDTAVMCDTCELLLFFESNE